MARVPPPGPAMPFDGWCRVLVNRLRELLPDVKATRSRAGVTIRRPASAHVVKIRQEAGLAEGHPHGFVFYDTDGGPLRASNVTRRSWKNH